MRVDSLALVEDLAVPHRFRSAKRSLMLAGTAATSAVREGLHHPNPVVRAGCCQVLDHFLDEAALPELLENLDHPDPQVRGWAVHALACDRCKEGSCRPAESDSLPVAIRMLLKDPSRQVRQQAAGLVGPAVHRSPDALAAIVTAHQSDPHPVVRKIAGWWVPGGARFQATEPRPVRTITPPVCPS